MKQKEDTAVILTEKIEVPALKSKMVVKPRLMKNSRGITSEMRCMYWFQGVLQQVLVMRRNEAMNVKVSKEILMRLKLLVFEKKSISIIFR
eukprot:4636725-Amphidinium_carterae.3